MVGLFGCLRNRSTTFVCRSTPGGALQVNLEVEFNTYRRVLRVDAFNLFQQAQASSRKFGTNRFQRFGAMLGR